MKTLGEMLREAREDKDTLMKYAEDHDLSASQIVRQLIRKYLLRLARRYGII